MVRISENKLSEPPHAGVILYAHRQNLPVWKMDRISENELSEPPHAGKGLS
jgi:hypothetical protein